MKGSRAGAMRKYEYATADWTDGKCVEGALLVLCGRKKGRVAAIEIVVEIYQECETGHLSPAVFCCTGTSSFVGYTLRLRWTAFLFDCGNPTRDILPPFYKLKPILVRLVADIVPIVSLSIQTRWRPSSVDVRSIVPPGHVAVESKAAVQSQWMQGSNSRRRSLLPRTLEWVVAMGWQEFLHSIENRPLHAAIDDPDAGMRQDGRARLACHRLVRAVARRLRRGDQAIAFRRGKDVLQQEGALNVGNGSFYDRKTTLAVSEEDVISRTCCIGIYCVRLRFGNGFRGNKLEVVLVGRFPISALFVPALSK
mmetsp:Transcript_6703/g.16502  ORF Transcript_6703/g.16502 Transcript_6703/m.16502 type:complete len:309 (-) Transcript_6703:1173-2099(-)